MRKYFNIELKNKIVSEYFSNQGDFKISAKIYGISHHTIQNWVDKQIKQDNQINDIYNMRGKKKKV